MSIKTRFLFIALLAIGIAGCASKGPEMKTVEEVDLERFMGPWYVIANIPTFLEKDAYNPVETYSLNDDGTIATHFTFRKGGFDGKAKEYHPKGFIKDTDTNALWGMQFIWPIKADYRVIWLNDDYSQTVIGRNKRDYVWLMAREPSLSEAEYEQAVAVIRQAGYDTALLQRVPQRW